MSLFSVLVHFSLNVFLQNDPAVTDLVICVDCGHVDHARSNALHV